jgi:hypothetical protein
VIKQRRAAVGLLYASRSRYSHQTMNGVADTCLKEPDSVTSKRSLVLKSLVLKVLPSVVRRSLMLVRTYQRNQKLNAVFANPRYDLDPLLMDGITVVPQRRAILAIIPKDARVAEIGVAQGEFAAEILEVCNPSKLYQIDLWNDSLKRYARSMEKVATRFSREIENGVVDLMRGYSWERIADLPDDGIDFTYVDAAHDYESVRRDLCALEPKIALGGFIRP